MRGHTHGSKMARNGAREPEKSGKTVMAGLQQWRTGRGREANQQNCAVCVRGRLDAAHRVVRGAHATVGKQQHMKRSRREGVAGLTRWSEAAPLRMHHRAAVHEAVAAVAWLAHSTLTTHRYTYIYACACVPERVCEKASEAPQIHLCAAEQLAMKRVASRSIASGASLLTEASRPISCTAATCHLRVVVLLWCLVHEPTSCRVGPRPPQSACVAQECLPHKVPLHRRNALLVKEREARGALQHGVLLSQRRQAWSEAQQVVQGSLLGTKLL